MENKKTSIWGERLATVFYGAMAVFVLMFLYQSISPYFGS